MLDETLLLAPQLANPEVAERFPKHGWAETRAGLGLLVIPVVRLVRDADLLRMQRGLPQRGQNRGQRERISYAQAFEETLRRLTRVLREVAALRRIASDRGPGWEMTDGALRMRVD